MNPYITTDIFLRKLSKLPAIYPEHLSQLQDNWLVSYSYGCQLLTRLFREEVVKRALHLACLLGLLVGLASLSRAQDSPGRFEAGGNFTALHNPGGNGFGPGIDGSVNFGRFLALDASFNWLAARPISVENNSLVFSGFFGLKAGKRFQHFGVFGKARPGFITAGKVLREFDVQTILPSNVISQRDARLTQFALDAGGVLEYYASRRWTLRYDFSDAIIRSEPLILLIEGQRQNAFTPHFTNNFQFSTSIRYRF